MRGGTVRVTRRDELEGALRRADRIVVEGDPALTDWVKARLVGAPVAAASGLHGVEDADRAAHVPVGQAPNRLWPWIVGAAVLAALVGAAFVVEHFSLRQAGLRPEFARPHGGGGEAPAAGADWAQLAWAGVAVVVAVLVFLLARRALDSGRDVTLAWKIGSQAEGRVEFVRRAT